VGRVQEFGDYRVATVAVKDEVLRLKLTPGIEVPADATWVVLPEDRICIYADDVLVAQR
jgi:hypothetical protein